MDLCVAKRKQSLALMACLGCCYALEFFMIDGTTRLTDPTVAAKVTALARVGGFSTTLLVGLGAYVGCFNMEVATIIQSLILAVCCFCSNVYRVSQVFGGDLFYRLYGECDAAVCYDDTDVVLFLVACSTVTMVFAPVRVSRSWVLIFSTIALYGAGSAPGIGPMLLQSHMIICSFYAILVIVLWARTCSQEIEFRQHWFDNRRLRERVARQQRLYESQQRWLNEVSEQLEALHSSSALSKSQRQQVRSEMSDDIVGTVPRPDDMVRRAPGLDEAHATAPAEWPNATLAGCLAGRRADRELVRRMAQRIRDPDYCMRSYFEDCVAAFPELDLFFATATTTSSGVAGPKEYQRTIGALFAVYWLLRLDLDGRHGLSFGCDEDWAIRAHPNGVESAKKQAFFDSMDWSLFGALADSSVGHSVERIEAMLCLTAFHDIMKVTELTPVVAAEHAPYHRCVAGDIINDHDLALAYVLEKYPDLLPSFSILPESSRELVLFTQAKMTFNHGWFVQAEGTPGAMLSPLKCVLGRAASEDLAFYFFHWCTDLSGAEGAPLAGAEKLVVKFPISVLVSFLWSIPHLQRLVDSSETEVVERYLEARFRLSLPHEELPTGRHALAQMRLVVMAQRGAQSVLDAFRAAPEVVQAILGEEMALTGIDGQTFLKSPYEGGPAFLVYYGPALLQRCKSLEEMSQALLALAAVYRAGRKLWRREGGHAGHTVTLQVSRLKALDMSNAVDGRASSDPSVWVLTRENEREACLELLGAESINALMEESRPCVCVDLKLAGEVSRREPSSAILPPQEARQAACAVQPESVNLLKATL